VSSLDVESLLVELKDEFVEGGVGAGVEVGELPLVDLILLLLHQIK